MGKHWHEVLPKGYDHHRVDLQVRKVRSESLNKLGKPTVENYFDEEPNFSGKDANNNIRKHKHAKTITFWHGGGIPKEDVKKIADKHARAIFRRRFSEESGTIHVLPSRDEPEIYHESY